MRRAGQVELLGKEPVMPDFPTEFERTMEEATGESIENLRRIPIDERRRLVERIKAKPCRFESWFPLIGRGNVLRNRLESHQAIEQALDNVIA